MSKVITRFSMVLLTFLAIGSAHSRAAAGVWTLEKISALTDAYDTTELFGNKFLVGIDLKYTPGSGGMIEPPLLDWHEKFVVVDYAEKTRWVFEKNMYELNPHSRTLKVWNNRYICAYEQVSNPTLLTCPSIFPSVGGVKLQDLKRNPISLKTLGKATIDAKKADAVRKYLQKKGGYLLISLVDIPSLLIPTEDDESVQKNRLLIFDIGVKGNSKLRAKGFQLLQIDSSKPKGEWTRKCEASESSLKDLSLPEGFKNIPPPENVSTQGDKIMSDGKYL